MRTVLAAPPCLARRRCGLDPQRKLDETASMLLLLLLAAGQANWLIEPQPATAAIFAGAGAGSPCQRPLAQPPYVAIALESRVHACMRRQARAPHRDIAQVRCPRHRRMWGL
jgi:hypothetical protein